jgi:VCBS repeat-containing protein
MPLDLTPIPLGTDIQVNTTTASYQYYPSLAPLADGGFVVTWTSYDQDGSDYGIYGQRYDATGVPAGDEFQVNTETTSYQLQSSVAALVDGGFVVTWSSYLQDGDGYGIYGQRYDTTGATVGGEFRVNTETSSDQVYSSVAALADGGFVVTWSSYLQDGSDSGIYGQRYDGTGATAGTEFRVNTVTTSDQISPSVAALADGGFVVTWSSQGQDGDSFGIYGQRYDATGATVGTEFQVNTETAHYQEYPSVAALADGGFVVTWLSYLQDGSESGIYGQRYDADGVPAGDEFRVNTETTSDQIYPSVAALADGGFVVTWSSVFQDGDAYGIFGQRYDATGAEAGVEFRLNDITAGTQINLSYYGSEFVAQLADGRLVATWSGQGIEEVFTRLFDLPLDTALNTPPEGTDARITLDEDTSHTFSAADFGFTDPDAGAALAAVRIDTLPAAGALTLDGDAVTRGQVIAASDVGALVFTPEANADGLNFASLAFSVSDGSVFDSTPNRLTFDVTPVDDGVPSLTPIPLGTDLQVNTTTANVQDYPSLAPLADGGFVVTWTSYDQDGSAYGIYGQRYDATGATTGDEFQVNTTTADSQYYSSVAALADGGFVVTWSSYGQDGSDRGIYGQRYDVDGGPAGGEFRVNTYTMSSQDYSSVAALADGGFVVTWSSLGQDGDGYGIYGQRYDATGATVGGEFRINTETASAQIYSSVAALADGGFVVTWSSNGQDGSSWGIYGQRYDATGATVGTEFQVNTETSNNQLYSSVAALADGGFVVTWSSFDQDGDDWGIYGQRYDATGATAGDEFQVNTVTTFDQIYSSVAALADGGFVVTWSSYIQDGSFDWGMFGQRYDATGAEAGDEFRLNGITDGGQVNESSYGSEFVAQLADGRLVATWSGSGSEEVFARLFDLPVDTGLNTPPEGTNDTIAAVEGETPQGNVLDNDTDVDAGQILTVIGVTGPNGSSETAQEDPGTNGVGQEIAGTYGVLTLQADGSYTYAAQNTPLPAGQTASETFTYTVSDGNGGTDTADIVVTVTGGNPPFGNNPGQVQGTIAATGKIEGVGDFDANGRLDFLWRDTTTSVVELRTSTTGGNYTSNTLGTVGANYTFETTGDLDGNGSDDFVIRDAATGETGAWIMRNGAPADWRALGNLGPEWDIAGAGDVDRNGTDDLLLFNTTTRAVDVWLQGATGPGARATVGTVAAGWEVAAIGDLDGNGTDDVLFFNAGTRQLGAWQMGEGRPGGWFNYGVLADGWEVTKIGNFNGTGAEDIGFYNAATGQDGAWSMFAGTISDWIAKGTHDDLDPIGTGRLGGTTDQILWHNTANGAVVTF